MNARPILLVATTSCAIAFVSFAGEYNPTLSVGDPAPAWKNLPGTDGKQHSLSDLAKTDVVVVVFTCNSCPVAEAYEDRIIAFAKKYTGPGKKVALVAINVNKVEEDLLPAMKERAEAKHFPFTYLFDESQQIAKDYGASYTPECFVLDRKRKIAYLGGMDDNSNPDKVQEHYLEPAVDAVLKGEKPKTGETLARGCMIQFERQRRKRT